MPSSSYIRGHSSKVAQADILNAVTSINTTAASIHASVNGTLVVTDQYTYSTEALFSAEMVADGANVTSAVFDLGEDSHLISDISLFLNLSVGIFNWNLQLEVSPDNVTWYGDGAGTFTYAGTKQVEVINVEGKFGSASRGCRYYRFKFFNNDGMATITDVTLTAAGYF